MEGAQAQFELAQAEEASEQCPSSESIQSELEVAANRRFIHEAGVKLEQLFTDEED